MPDVATPQTGPREDDRDARMAAAVDGFLARFWKGEDISVDAWADQHGDLAGELRLILPTLIEINGATSSTIQPPPPPVIQRFGDCRVVKVLGQGGMGKVYEGVQDGLDRPVAIKVLIDAGADETQHQRFLREARLAAALDHPHIVPIHAVGTQDGLPYLVMKLIRGGSLVDQIRDLAAMAPAERHRRAVDLITPVAWALAYAHGQGIQHRDIKPANILVDDEGKSWLADFGLAKGASSSDLTRSGMVTGTLHYLAPERLEGKGDHRADLYALGLTLLELASAKPCFDGMNPSEVVRHIVLVGAPLPQQHDPGLPTALAARIAKATARDPDRRYPTALQFAEDLERWSASGPSELKPLVPVQPPPPLPPRTVPTSEPRSWFWPLVAGAGLVILVLWWSGAEQPPSAPTIVPVVAPTPTPPALREVDGPLTGDLDFGDPVSLPPATIVSEPTPPTAEAEVAPMPASQPLPITPLQPLAQPLPPPRRDADTTRLPPPRPPPAGHEPPTGSGPRPPPPGTGPRPPPPR